MKHIDLHDLKTVIESHLDSKDYHQRTHLMQYLTTVMLRTACGVVKDHWPLLFQYVSTDLSRFPQLYKKFESEFHENTVNRLQTASTIYANFYREKSSGDQYEKDEYLPMRVVPGQHQNDEFSGGATKCQRCKRMFPYSFSVQIKEEKELHTVRCVKRTNLELMVKKT